VNGSKIAETAQWPPHSVITVR